MHNRTQVAFLTGLLLVTVSPATQAAEPAAAKPTIDAIAKVARDLCARPNMYGYTRRNTGQIEGHLDVTKLLRRLLNAGVSAQAKGEGTAWSGVVQRDATAALRDSNQCTTAMFSLMFNHFYVQPTARRAPPAPPKRPANRAAKAAKAASVEPKTEGAPTKVAGPVPATTAPSPPAVAPVVQVATSPPADAPPPAVVRPTDVQRAAAREHRDAGDELFKRLLDARKPASINALIPETEAWDRAGADIVVDAFGIKAKAAYEATGPTEFYPPSTSKFFGFYASIEEQDAFWRRHHTLNMIRHRQAALSTLFAPR